MPTTTAKPLGHDHRVNLARHRPESRPLRVCDIAHLLTLSATAVRDRDAQLRPAMLGLKTKAARRYSWASYLAFVDSVTPTKE